MPVVHVGYSAAKKRKAPITPEKRRLDYLKDLGIQGTENRRWMNRIVHYKGNMRIPILETTQDASQGVIVVKQSWNKERDPEPKASWTQMVMDNWRTVATAAHVQDLRYMIQDNIQDITVTDSRGIRLNTPEAIREVYGKLRADTLETLTIDPRSSDADELASYQLLAAQTHVARPLQLLKDYHQELGDLKIAKLHLMHIDHFVARAYHIIIEFGR